MKRKVAKLIMKNLIEKWMEGNYRKKRRKFYIRVHKKWEERHYAEESCFADMLAKKFTEPKTKKNLVKLICLMISLNNEESCNKGFFLILIECFC